MATETTTSESAEQAAVQAAGMTYIGNYKITDDTAYSPTMLDAMMDNIVARVKAGERILIHDTAGRGRMGFWEAAFMLWDGWTTTNAMNRYVSFGWKIDCINGGNGQMQGINEVATALGLTTYFPSPDTYGTTWQNCPRPSYMNGWNYNPITWPAGRGQQWSITGTVPGRP